MMQQLAAGGDAVDGLMALDMAFGHMMLDDTVLDGAMFDGVVRNEMVFDDMPFGDAVDRCGVGDCVAGLGCNLGVSGEGGMWCGDGQRRTKKRDRATDCP
jgi:hypothetical protein